MSEHGNAPVQNFYGPDDPLPHIPYGPVRRHWVSTLIVGLIVLFYVFAGGVAAGLAGALTFLAVAGLLTGIYVAATGRKSWAHIPGGRRAGAILIGVSLVLMVIGLLTLHPKDPAGSADTGQPTTVVEPERAAAPAPEVVPAPDPVPEPAYVAPEPVYESPAPAAAPDDSSSAQYANCTEVKAAGAAPIHIGEPGWDPKFDKDGDGTGCELDK